MANKDEKYEVVNVAIQTQPTIHLQGAETTLSIEETLVLILNKITVLEGKIG